MLSKKQKLKRKTSTFVGVFFIIKNLIQIRNPQEVSLVDYLCCLEGISSDFVEISRQKGGIIMTHRVFPVEKHYLVEIDKYRNAIESDEVEKVFVWDIYIASDGKENYRGKAIESTGEYKIDWIELDEIDLLQEMIRHCQMLTLEI